MTNLEFYKDDIYKTQKDLFENRDIRVSYGIGIAICEVYEKHKGVHAFMPMVLDWLLEEYKEPIKLKQWEKDMLETTYNKHTCFTCYMQYMKMRNLGHFKGVVDTTMRIDEILDNCEVVE